MAEPAIALEGDKELERQLKKMPDVLFQKTVSKAVSKAMTPINRQARANANAVKDTGALKRSIGKRTRKYKKSGVVVGVVGVKRDHSETDDKGKKHVPTNYAHLVEYGHKIAVGGTLAYESLGEVFKAGATARKGKSGRRGKGENVGSVPPRPLLRHAFETKEDTAYRVYKRELARGVDRAARETGKGK
jgi:HK97 gp10 family phage protein